jgi:hypothetical protein
MKTLTCSSPVHSEEGLIVRKAEAAATIRKELGIFALH